MRANRWWKAVQGHGRVEPADRASAGHVEGGSSIGEAVLRHRVPRLVLALVATAAMLVMAGTVGASRAGATPVPSSGASIWGLHVVGNQIRNGRGQVFRPTGVSRSGTEYPCVQGSGIFDGPHDAAAAALIASWHANTVRVSLNEDCWLGINGVPAAYSGANYRTAIEQWVSQLNSQNMAVILDLHWNAPGTRLATGQQPMADLDHAPAFWTSVAQAFKGNSSVIFDLYNEPYTTSWACWRDGSTAPSAAPCTDVPFAVAGMQTLVDAVRSTGARNVLMLGGLRWANNLTQWLQYEPSDPLHNLAASFHLYNWNACITTGCWDSQLLPVMRHVPLIAGEFGEGDFAPAGIVDCGKQTFVDNFMNWMDIHGGGYLGWAWVPYGCGFPSLLSSWDGTPSGMGLGFKNRFTALSEAGLEAYGRIDHQGGGVARVSVLLRNTAPLTGTVITLTLPGQQGVSPLTATAPAGRWSTAVTRSNGQIVYTFTQRSGTVVQPEQGYQAVTAVLQEAPGVHLQGAQESFSLTAQAGGQTLSDQGSIYS